MGPTSFEFVVPDDAPIIVSPSVGTVEPGKVKLSFKLSSLNGVNCGETWYPQL